MDCNASMSSRYNTMREFLAAEAGRFGAPDFLTARALAFGYRFWGTGYLRTSRFEANSLSRWGIGSASAAFRRKTSMVLEFDGKSTAL